MATTMDDAEKGDIVTPLETAIDEEPETTKKLSLKDRFIGDYPYGRFCKPRFNPWATENKEPMPFFGRDAHLAWLVTAMLGFQHSLAVSDTEVRYFFWVQRFGFWLT
jgi:hypothetical protein